MFVFGEAWACKDSSSKHLFKFDVEFCRFLEGAIVTDFLKQNDPQHAKMPETQRKRKFEAEPTRDKRWLQKQILGVFLCRISSSKFKIVALLLARNAQKSDKKSAPGAVPPSVGRGDQL